MMALDGDIWALYDEIIAWYEPPPALCPVSQKDYDLWSIRWMRWRDDHMSTWSRIGTDPKLEFNEFVRSYNRWRALWIAGGEPTKTPTHEVPTPEEEKETIQEGLGTVRILGYAAIAIAAAYGLGKVAPMIGGK
jgi:hypothetical protein